MQNCRFSAPRMTNKSCHFVHFCLKTHILQNIVLTIIGKSNIFKFYIVFFYWQCLITFRKLFRTTKIIQMINRIIQISQLIHKCKFSGQRCINLRQCYQKYHISSNGNKTTMPKQQSCNRNNRNTKIQYHRARTNQCPYCCLFLNRFFFKLF